MFSDWTGSYTEHINIFIHWVVSFNRLAIHVVQLSKGGGLTLVMNMFQAVQSLDRHKKSNKV